MCKHNSRCGCSSNRQCENFGPFVAIDAACITSPPLTTTTGSIIPFSSGIESIFLTSLESGLIESVSLIGFGTGINGVLLTGTNIVTTTLTEAFSVPRAGTITSISATFSATAVSPLPGVTTIRAQIYRATAGSNVFSPTTAFVDLSPSLTTIAVGTIVSGTANVTPVPVTAGDRLLMVFSVTSTGAVTIFGNASAGINIV